MTMKLRLALASLFVLVGLSAPSQAAVGIGTHTIPLDVQGATLQILAEVRASASLPDNCPRRQGDPSDGETTVCIYAYTALEFQAFGEWLPYTYALGVGPIPPKNSGGFTTLCKLDGRYRTLFSQIVEDLSGEEEPWVDRRWREDGVEIDCDYPLVQT